MRVLIRVDANSSMGTGHVTRMMSLTAALVGTEHSVMIAYQHCPDTLVENFHHYGADSAELKGDETDEIRHLAQITKSDFIVVDGYQFDDFYYSQLNLLGLPIMMLDDYGQCREYTADLIVNQNPGADSTLYKKKKEKTRLLLGTDYALLRPEFLDYPQKPPSDKHSPERFLISMGGADLENATLPVLQSLLGALKTCNSKKYSISLLAGAANPHLTLLKEAAITESTETIEIQVLQNINDMASLLSKTDVLISAGGTTVFEAAYLGLPNFVLQTAANQKGVLHLEKVGAIVYLGQFGKVSTFEMTTLLKSKLDPSFLSSLAIKSSSIIDGRGAERIVTTMNEVAIPPKVS